MVLSQSAGLAVVSCYLLGLHGPVVNGRKLSQSATLVVVSSGLH